MFKGLDYYKNFIKGIDLVTIYNVANKLGHEIFHKGVYNLNIWGVRCDIDDSGCYNDLMLVFYKEDKKGDMLFKWYTVTTDPSTHNLLNPVNWKGCAILKEGQYKGMLMLGNHKGASDHPALVQVKPCTVYRDTNKDENLDFNGKTDTGLFGINVHRASKWSIVDNIGLYSAGCQVHHDVNRYNNEFIPLCKKGAETCGNSFTYTLVNIDDFINHG